MRRLAALLFAAVILLPAPVAAVFPSPVDGFTFYGPNLWADDACNLPRGGQYNHFEVQVSRDESGGGPDTYICSNWNNFCLVPLTAEEIPEPDCASNDYADNRVSSVYTLWLQAGWDVCLYTLQSYGGSTLRLQNGYADVSALGSLNDKFSSIRGRQEGTAC